MEIKKQALEAERRLKNIQADHQSKIQVEENMLVNAKMDLPLIDYLKLEADVESKRAVREFTINQLKANIEKLKSQLKAYMIDLKAKTPAMRKVRDQKFEEDYINKFVKTFKEKAKDQYDHFFERRPYESYVQAAKKKIMPVDTYQNEYGRYLFRWRYNGRPSHNNQFTPFDPSKYTMPLQRYYYAAQLAGGPYTPFKEYVPISQPKSHGDDRYAEYFGIPMSTAFKLFNSARKKRFGEKIVMLKNHKHGNPLILQGPKNQYHGTFVPRVRKGADGTALANNLTIYDVIDYFYPSVQDYEANPDNYPHAIGFLEEHPFPNKNDLEKAFRSLVGIGTQKWAEKQIKHLKEKAEFNTRKIDENAPYYMWTKSVLALPNGYYDREKQKKIEIPYRNLAPFETVNPNLDPAIKYYAPRPKPGHLYVPEYDYINPLEYVPYDERERKIYTPKGEYLKAVADAERRAAKQARNQKWQRFEAGISAALGGGMVGMIFNPGALVSEIACVGFGYDSNPCKTMQDVAAVSRTFVQAWVAGAVGQITGGAGAAIAGAVTSVASDPNLGLSDSDLGRVLIALAEAYAIASVTDAAIDKALTEVLENQIYNITKREIGKATGLDKTLLGRVGLDLSAGTAFGMYKDKEFMEALTGSADKSWRVAVARENPYGAILMAGVTEIEKNNWSINSNNPMDWFESIDIGDEFKRIRHSIRGKDLAKIIGLTYMVQAGKISEGDALLMVGQEASKRNIERFYQDKPIYEDPEMEAYREKQAEVNRWKKGIAVMQKLSTGVPPSKEDVMVISDNVAGPIYDRVQAMGIPTKYEVKLWDIAINEVGLPNVAQYTPDVSFTVPDWMKSSKSDGNVVITNKDQMENYLGKKFNQETEFTKEDLVMIILGLFPRNVPLVPVSSEPVAPTFNWIDDFGDLKVRDPLKFPYDHPMIKVGQIKKKYTQEQKAHMDAREQEMLQARIRMQKLEKQLSELQSHQGIV